MNPDWAAIEADVLRKLFLLRVAWERTAEQEPEVHAVIKRDLYIPALRLLAEFSSCITEEAEEEVVQ